MKIVHLSNSTEGGAGIAAQRLNQALIRCGVDSSLLTLSTTTDGSEFRVKRGPLAFLIGKINSLVAGSISRNTFFSFFSVNVISERKLRRFLAPKDGILHIHNWFNFLSQRNLMRLADLGYKIVLTLHDERMLTGGCHYALNCHGFESGCLKCPQIASKLRIFPRRTYSRNSERLSALHSPLHLIAPSKWIADEAHKSNLLKTERIYIIQNSMGNHENQFGKTRSPRNSIEVNSIIRLGVASQDPSSFIKGGDLIQKMKENPLFMNNFEFIFMKDFAIDQKSDFWEKIDFLFVPSRIDNSPNVIHEAKSLGVPVIGTNVGGISELLTNTDLLIDLPNINPIFLVSLKSQLLSILENTTAMEDSRISFKEWSAESAKKHIELYEQIFS